jgi:hypothetical protein
VGRSRTICAAYSPLAGESDLRRAHSLPYVDIVLLTRARLEQDVPMEIVVLRASSGENQTEESAAPRVISIGSAVAVGFEGSKLLILSTMTICYLAVVVDRISLEYVP